MTKKNQSGQSLVLLLFFVLMAMTFAATAIIMTIVNAGSVTTLQSGIEIRQLADSAAENGLLRLIRDPFYTGETYTLGDVTVTTTVTGTITKVVTSEVILGQTKRKVEVSASYVDNILRVVPNSWKEVF